MDATPQSTSIGGIEQPWLKLACLAFRIQHVAKASLRKVAGNEDLSATEALILLCCNEFPHGIIQKDLSKLTSCSAALVSTHLEALSCRNFLISRRDSHDRRLKLWAITGAGQQVALRLTQGLDPNQQLRDFAETLGKLNDAEPDFFQRHPNDQNDQGVAA